jgi:hypothetical protein
VTNVSTTVTVNLAGLNKFAGQVPVRMKVILQKWTVRYRIFIQRRFDQYSKGGGDWPPLKYRHGTILRDTNTLFTAMSPTLNPPPGSVNIFGPDSVEIGFGGSAAHPGGPTVRQIAEWHHSGAGNLPIRQIIVVPPQYVLDGMVNDAQAEMDK